MGTTIICYKLGRIEDKTRTEFKRKLFVYKNKSFHGRYEYETKGILKKGEYAKPINGLLIIKNNDKVAGVIKLLRKYKAKYKAFEIKREI